MYAPPPNAGAEGRQQDIMATADATGALGDGLLAETSTEGGLIAEKIQTSYG